MAWRASNNPTVRARWRARVDALEASGESAAAFARRHELGIESLRRWRKLFRAQPQLPALVEVVVADPVETAGSPRMVIELPNGRRVHLEPGFDPRAVTQLVRLLEHM